MGFVSFFSRVRTTVYKINGILSLIFSTPKKYLRESEIFFLSVTFMASLIFFAAPWDRAIRERGCSSHTPTLFRFSFSGLPIGLFIGVCSTPNSSSKTHRKAPSLVRRDSLRHQSPRWLALMASDRWAAFLTRNTRDVMCDDGLRRQNPADENALPPKCSSGICHHVFVIIPLGRVFSQALKVAEDAHFEFGFCLKEKSTISFQHSQHLLHSQNSFLPSLPNLSRVIKPSWPPRRGGRPGPHVPVAAGAPGRTSRPRRPRAASPTQHHYAQSGKGSPNRS